MVPTGASIMSSPVYILPEVLISSRAYPYLLLTAVWKCWVIKYPLRPVQVGHLAGSLSGEVTGPGPQGPL